MRGTVFICINAMHLNDCKSGIFDQPLFWGSYRPIIGLISVVLLMAYVGQIYHHNHFSPSRSCKDHVNFLMLRPNLPKLLM